jgi:monodehydroascorbate reductase (NADH)
MLLQTSVDDVYAIGDVAAFPLLAADGAIVRQEHVTHARSSAAQAAKAIMGEAHLHTAGMRMPCT